MKNLCTGAMMVLTALTFFACQPSHLALPIHDAPLATNLGLDYLAGELRVEDGCLKLYRLGWDFPNRAVSEQLRLRASSCE